MARKWSNLNPSRRTPLHNRNFLDRIPNSLVVLPIIYSQGDEPLAVDHDRWWPEDSKQLSQAMKEMGWYSFEKRR